MDDKAFIDDLEKCLDGSASPAEQERLLAAAALSAEHAELLRQMVVMDCRLATLRCREARCVERVLAEITRPGDAEAMAHRVRQRLEAELPPHRVAPALAGRQWRRILTLAAVVALVAGGLWWYPRLAGAPALGLRLAESQGAVTVTRAGKTVPVSRGLALQDGDRVTLTEGSKAALKYDAEETKIELHSAMASVRAEKGAKRVRLDAGLLFCTAAPQRQPFRLETPQAVAEVVGTRFWLDASAAETTLAVQAGTVALRRGAQRLEIAAGEMATADAAGLQKLSPSAAWLKELLARAEAGPWDAVDFGQCNTRDQEAGWLIENRPGADRRFWNLGTGGWLLFARAPAQRGVFTARLMILPAGELPPELAPPPAAQRVAGAPGVNDVLITTGIEPHVAIEFYGGDRTASSRGAYETRGVPLLRAAKVQRGVWYRCAVYVDQTAAERAVLVFAVWPEAAGRAPTAADWTGGVSPKLAAGTIGSGLTNYGVPTLVQGLKFVPLGPDLPPPP